MSDIQNIYDDDTVSRWIYKPIHFDLIGKIDFTKTFQFSSANEHSESVNCNRLLDPKTSLHEMGESRAIKYNQNLGNKKLRKYEGYISSLVQKLRGLNNEDYVFNVLHCPEFNNPAHCHLKLSLFKKDKSLRNMAIEKLHDCFGDLIEP